LKEFAMARTHASSHQNPFALMVQPEDVLKAIEGSDALSGLRTRVVRPLDRPVLVKLPDDVIAYDRRIDQSGQHNA
jgi:hypothetical protein